MLVSNGMATTPPVFHLLGIPYRDINPWKQNKSVLYYDPIKDCPQSPSLNISPAKNQQFSINAGTVCPYLPQFPSPALNQRLDSIIITSLMSAHPQNDLSPSQCRICLENNEKEPLTCACLCRGSIGHQHLSCLQEYYSFRLHRLDPTQQQSAHKRLLCEVCLGEVSCLAV